MFAPLKATFALLIRGLETAEALDNIHTGWDELLEDLEPWISLMAWIRAKLDEKSNPSSDDEDFRQAVNNYTKVVIEAIKEVLEELEKLTTPEFMPQAKRLGTLRIDPERMKRIRQKLQEAHNRYSTSVGFVTNNKIDVVGEGISKLRVEVRHALDIKDLPGKQDRMARIPLSVDSARSRMHHHGIYIWLPISAELSSRNPNGPACQAQTMG